MPFPHPGAYPTNAMKTTLLCSVLLALPLAACTSLQEGPAESSVDAEQAVRAVLHDFLLAKSEMDEERFYGHLAADAIVFGTDAPERWTVDELRIVMDPYFAQTSTWATHVVDQNVSVSEDGRFAWFDELLMSERYGEMRASGVLRLVDDEWKIAQYNLVFIVPNEIALDLLKMTGKLPKDQ